LVFGIVKDKQEKSSCNHCAESDAGKSVQVLVTLIEYYGLSVARVWAVSQDPSAIGVIKLKIQAQ
jgi:hypothetical protein